MWQHLDLAHCTAVKEEKSGSELFGSLAALAFSSGILHVAHRVVSPMTGVLKAQANRHPESRP